MTLDYKFRLGQMFCLIPTSRELDPNEARRKRPVV